MPAVGSSPENRRSWKSIFLETAVFKMLRIKNGDMFHGFFRKNFFSSLFLRIPHGTVLLNFFISSLSG